MLELNFFMLIITIAVFSYLVIYLNKTLYAPILSFTDLRDETIAKEEKKISENNSDAGHLKAKIEEIISQAKQEAIKIKQDAQNEAKSKANTELSNQKLQLDSDFEKFMKDLEVKKVQLKDELLKNLPQFQNDLKQTIAKI